MTRSATPPAVPHSAPPESCVLVLFGASGDLAKRKLVPSLYELDRRGQLPEHVHVLGVSRTPMTDDEFRRSMGAALKEFTGSLDERAWAGFAPRLHYGAGDATERATFGALSERIATLGAEHGICRDGGGGMGSPNVLFYLSVSPDLYEPIIANIGDSGLVTEGKRWCSLSPHETPWQRIIVEKPFGVDLHSAHSLNMALGRVFEEESIFRIDHYLGKELVQNLLVLRFANTIFEPMWNRAHVDHVQVSASETLGVGSRAANFYDRAGAIRDMIQSHLLQVLALVAIEPPSAYDADSIMREKIKLFNSARPTRPEEVASRGVLGRYGGGGAGGADRAYEHEKGVDPERRTETYAAMRIEFDTWRWAGVPFYLRSGKKMARKLTEVVVEFKRPPTDLFRRLPGGAALRAPNRLIVHIAPTEGISLLVQGKVPGSTFKIDAAALALDYLERFGGEVIEAYGPLLLDAMRGDRTLYKHRDEVEGGWRICQPFLENADLRRGIKTYAPGSWGPAEADELLGREGRAWHNPGAGER